MTTRLQRVDRNWKGKGSFRRGQLSSCQQGPQYQVKYHDPLGRRWWVLWALIGEQAVLLPRRSGQRRQSPGWTSVRGRSPGPTLAVTDPRGAPPASPPCRNENTGLRRAFEWARETVKCRRSGKGGCSWEQRHLGLRGRVLGWGPHVPNLKGDYAAEEGGAPALRLNRARSLVFSPGSAH